MNISGSKNKNNLSPEVSNALHSEDENCSDVKTFVLGGSAVYTHLPLKSVFRKQLVQFLPLRSHISYQAHL